MGDPGVTGEREASAPGPTWREQAIAYKYLFECEGVILQPPPGLSDAAMDIIIKGLHARSERLAKHVEVPHG
jgi:hypothetical protein